MEVSPAKVVMRRLTVRWNNNLVGIGWQFEVISDALGGELRSQGGDLNVGPRSERD